MIIRLEQPKDYREVENLTREAFWNVYRPGCTEHYVLNQYRTNPNFIPELDLVMIENDQISSIEFGGGSSGDRHDEEMKKYRYRCYYNFYFYEEE